MAEDRAWGALLNPILISQPQDQLSFPLELNGSHLILPR